MAKASDSHDYVRGSQEIGEQMSTFALFGGLIKWGSLSSAVLMLFCTLWFRPGGDFFQGLIAAVVLTAVGVYVLRAKRAADH